MFSTNVVLQAAIEHIRHDYFEGLRTDLEILQKDYDCNVGELRESHRAKTGDLDAFVKGLEKKLSADIVHVGEDLKAESLRTRRDLDLLRDQKTKLARELKDTHEQLCDRVEIVSDSFHQKVTLFATDLEKKCATLGTNLEGCRKEFMTDLKKQSQHLSDECEFKIEGVNDKVERVKLVQSEQTNSLKVLREDASKGLEDCIEEVDAKMAKLRSDLGGEFTEKLDVVTAETSRVSENFEAGVEALRAKITDEIADWGGKVGGVGNCVGGMGWPLTS